MSVRRRILINSLPWEHSVCQMHGTHGTQVIIFADVVRSLSKLRLLLKEYQELYGEGILVLRWCQHGRIG